MMRSRGLAVDSGSATERLHAIHYNTAQWLLLGVPDGSLGGDGYGASRT